MTSVAYLFPGQGVQSPDHEDAVRRSAPDLLEIAITAIGENPFPRCGESTRFAQPAIVLASLAEWRATEPEPDAIFAGHSLGEISALAAAGAIAEGDAVQLAVLRGELMAQAAEREPGGGMLAVLGGRLEDARRLAAEHSLVVANDNAPGQTVLAGPGDGIADARRAARSRGLRAIALDVAGAFHSPQMRSARDTLLATFEQFEWRLPYAPVLSGLTTATFTEPARELANAVVSPVRWRELMQELRGRGAARFVDVGPGRVLAKLTERIFPEVLDGAGLG